MNSISIYIHIPFCIKKCKYCDFLSAPAKKTVQEEYLLALKQEMIGEAEKYKDYTVKTVYIGGGTPSVVDPDGLCGIIKKLFEYYRVEEDAELSMEINPGTVNPDSLQKYRKAGINRLSIGLQSTHNRELELLGRIHTYEDFLIAYENARKAGFENINVDLMGALPGQSLTDYEESLKRVISLKPEHISTYSLIVEENTEFYKIYGEEKEKIERTGEGYGILPSEETEREMAALAETMLTKEGYRHYEISNYAKEGKACKHNIVYWKRGNYIGFGLGAASLFENTRFTNTKNLTDYLKNPVDKREVEKLSVKDCMEEFMFLGLRMYEGVNDSDFIDCFGKSMYTCYKAVIDKNKEEGLLMGRENLRLTDKGFCFANYIMAQFLL